jgi:UDP-glucose 4-epimerase
MIHVIYLKVAAHARHRVAVFNLGAAEYCRVSESIGWICEALGLDPRLEYSGGDRGWIGDNPFIFLDTTRITATGWNPKLNIREGVLKTLRWLEANRWILDAP